MFEEIGGRLVNYSEKTIQNKIIKDLKDRGYWVMKTQGGVAGTPIGTPDIIACDESGCFTSIEVKKIGGKLSEEQRLQLDRISDKSHNTYITNDKEFVEKISCFWKSTHSRDEVKNLDFSKTVTYWVYRGRFYEVLND